MQTNNKGVISSVLGTVSTVANTVTSTFNAVGTGATMLNRFADEASLDQADKAKIHRKSFRSNLVTNAVLEQSKLQNEVEAYLASNPAIAETFKSQHAEYAALFAEAA